MPSVRSRRVQDHGGRRVGTESRDVASPVSCFTELSDSIRIVR
ncbi:hypothetical protein RSSM_06733 [Rhodopirellula sallentina SM41]|uniref:Uncharacterized protein n=1 Tax=Rhodopirellula sallentina SM41 TaxID=1263870 RepID=M5TRL4_9BACT|nr:hypothetical protein RSSM_06733 [Rhodopirellula sallentina SM41]